MAREFYLRIRRGYRRIVFVYAAVATAWILTTGWLIGAFSDIPKKVEWLEIGKGLFFVLVTTVLLYSLLERLAKQVSNVFGDRNRYRDRLATIVDSPLMGIAVWNRDGRLSEANDTLLSMWGYSREEFESGNLTFAQLSPPERLEYDIECLEGVISGGRRGPFEKLLWRKDDTRLPVLSGVTPFPGNSNEGVLFLIDDSDRREAMAELEALLDKLETRVGERTAELRLANEEIESFGYSLSHDMRSPLRSIEGMAALIRAEEPELGAEASRALTRIQENVGKLNLLIDSILRLSNLSQVHQKPEEVDFSEVCRAVLADLAAASPERRLETVVDDGLTIPGDRELVRVLAVNLLENAWKFTRERDPARIEVRREGDSIVVRDNGVGFDAERSEKMFKPFIRLHEPAEFPGTGIGLAMVERIVKRCHGTIEARSLGNEGAEFRMTFPRAGTEDKDEPV